MTLKFALEPSNAEDILYTQAGTPTLDLRFASNKSLVDHISGQNLITFTRSGDATYFDANGVLQTAGTDVARFDHDPVTGESLGLLIEESRTNLLLQSEDFSTTWLASVASVSTNTATAPNGTSTADTFIPNSGATISGNGNFHNLRQQLTVANATTYTLSCYVKSAGYLVLRFGLSSQLNLVNNYSDITVNLSTLSVTQTLGTGSVTPVGDGWYRITATGTTTGTTAYAVFVIADGGTADGTSGVYIWGAQLEAGSFPTSYIPTAGTTVTRNADVAQITGSNFSRWYSQSEGTVFVDAAIRQALNTPVLADFNDTTTTNRVSMGVTTGRLGQMFFNTAGVSQGATSTSNSLTVGEASFLTLAYAFNDCAISLNGGGIASDTTVTLPTVTNLSIGFRPTSQHLNGTISRLTYFDRRLPNDTLQSITSDTAPTTYGNLVLDSANAPAAIAGVAPTLDYRFAREKREIETVSLLDKLTYTGGNGTFVGSDGYIQPATTNLPRFDHDPLSRVSEGLLVEESRQNLLLRSEEFNEASWFKSNTTVTQNAALAPNGTLTADLATGTGTVDSLLQAATVESGAVATYSIYMKRSNMDWVRLTLLNGANEARAWFNINSGIVGTVAAVGTTTSVAASIQHAGDGWFRCTLTGAIPSQTAYSTFNTTASADASFTRVTGGERLLWGAQLEQASTPSTYIPTTASTVTRTADSATIDGTGILTGTYTIVEKPAGCAVESGGNIELQAGYTTERVMVFPASLSAQQITDIRSAM